MFRKKSDSGLLKLYAAFDATNFELTQEDINKPDGAHFKLKNNNLYFNGSYQGDLSDTWSMFGGLSYTHGNNTLNSTDKLVDDTENDIHAKLKFKKRFSNRFKLYFGAEYLASDFNEAFSDYQTKNDLYGYQDNIAATFVEADIFLSKKLAFKAGMRSEYSALFKEFTLAPRLSMAYKTSNKSQLSLAYGRFCQNPSRYILN